MTIEEAKELRDKALRLAIYTAERLMEPEVLSKVDCATIEEGE